MRVLLVCPFKEEVGRDDGPPFYVGRALAATPGIEVLRVSPAVPQDQWPEHDWLLHVDYGGDAFPQFPKYDPGPKSIAWESDVHWSKEAFEYRLEEAKRFRKVFVYFPDYTVKFNELGVMSVWLPTAADPTVYTPTMKSYVGLDTYLSHPADLEPLALRRIKRYDTCFVGFLGAEGRRNVLDYVFKALPNFHMTSGAFFGEAAAIYRATKLPLNISVARELNMRTFEILATRSCLFSDRQTGMAEIGLEDGENCVLFDSAEEAIEKAKFYLSHDDIREEIADRGYKWLLNGHTYFHRVQRLVKAMQDGVDLR